MAEPSLFGFRTFSCRLLKGTVTSPEGLIGSLCVFE